MGHSDFHGIGKAGYQRCDVEIVVGSLGIHVVRHLGTGRVLNSVEQVTQEQGLRETGIGMAAAGVEHTASIVALAPGGGVIAAIDPALVGGFVQAIEDVDPGGDVFEIVPLVGPDPVGGQSAGGGVGRILAAERVACSGPPDDRRTRHHQAWYPRPGVLGVGGGMNSDEPPPDWI